jgi:hypothetical protein
MTLDEVIAQLTASRVYADFTAWYSTYLGEEGIIATGDANSSMPSLPLPELGPIPVPSKLE